MMINFKILQIYLLLNHLHHHYDSFCESKRSSRIVVVSIIIDQYLTIYSTTILLIDIVNIKLNSSCEFFGSVFCVS
jgi:hypothetical protein